MMLKPKGEPIKIFFALAENLKEGPLKKQLHEKGIKHGLVCVKVYRAEQVAGVIKSDRS